MAAYLSGVTMALTLFSLNFLGDGLRDALDPQTRKFSLECAIIA
jgi:ABC-type dipeptide/oligopeptide/nickel transport system permease subunit